MIIFRAIRDGGLFVTSCGLVQFIAHYSFGNGDVPTYITCLYFCAVLAFYIYYSIMHYISRQKKQIN